MKKLIIILTLFTSISAFAEVDPDQPQVVESEAKSVQIEECDGLIEALAGNVKSTVLLESILELTKNAKLGSVAIERLTLKIDLGYKYSDIIKSEIKRVCDL